MTHSIELIVQFNSKNWTFFNMTERIELFSILLKDLTLLVFQHDSQYWTLFFSKWLIEIEPFFSTWLTEIEPYFSTWLKELNPFFLNTTQTIDFFNLTQELNPFWICLNEFNFFPIWFKLLSLIFKLTQRIDFFFKRAAWLIGLNLFFRKNLTSVF